MQEHGIRVREVYSAISNDQLADLICSMLRQNPNLGEKSVDGLLRAQGHIVQRQRIRDTIWAVDPEGVQARLRRCLHRREYQVEAPNALWHIDGYHKLIRWKIVIHGAIDGYSRLVVFLKAATNNRSETALSAFLQGVAAYGLPSRVRTDRGGENVLIGQYMIQHRGTDRGSVIMGRSVHNQRIERLWRDLFCGCISYFYYLFYKFENDGILDPDNPLDIYALHTVFLPKIQCKLDLFQSGWANHRMRTERNWSPIHLWIEGIRSLQSRNPNHCIIDGLHETDTEDLGIDWNGPVPSDTDENTVVVDEVESPLSDEDERALSSHLATLEAETDSEDGWITQFLFAKAFFNVL